MKRVDRRRWQAAPSLQELGELTALWLEGTIDSQPGYATGFGPDPETVPLVPVLAAANRAGYVTTVSQPGLHDADDPDLWNEAEPDAWSQRAAVEGWLAVHQVPELVTAAQDAGLITITHPVTQSWFRRRDNAGIDVTTYRGQPVTGFGRQYRSREVKTHYMEISDAALAAVLRAVSVTLAAPDYGPHERLWTVLGEWAAGQHVALAPGRWP